MGVSSQLGGEIGGESGERGGEFSALKSPPFEGGAGGG